MLAESLDAWFDGADWDATMSAFQQRRDEAMKPIYDATLDFTRMRDIGPAEQNILKAVFLSPSTTRAVAYGIVAQLANLLPPADQGRTAYISRMFAPAAEPTKA